MVQNGIYSARNGSYTTRAGVYTRAGRPAEMIEDFEEGYPRRDWKHPTWSGQAKHISETNYNITRTGDGAVWLNCYFEDWCLAENLDNPAEIGRPIRCWFYPFDWTTKSDSGTQYWFTLGHPSEDTRNSRLELNTIHTGTARIRYRNGGTARTIDALDGGTAHISNAHGTTENVWYAWDIRSPGCKALESSEYDEGQTIPPGEWQFALHENGEQDNPIIFDTSFSEYQDWPGDGLMKIGIWCGLPGDEVIFDDIQFLGDDMIEDPGDPGNGDDPEPDTLFIDDFEQYDSGQLPVNWTVDGSGSSDVSSSAALHPDSTQGVVQSGTTQIRSFPGDGLDQYPQDGRESTALFRPNSNTRQPWIVVNMAEDMWSTDTENWRLEIHMTSGIRIAYSPPGGGRDVVASDSDYSFTAGDTYEAHFLFDSSSGIEFWVVNENGTVVADASTTDTRNIDDEMSIGLRSSSAGVQWDWLEVEDTSGE